MALKSQLISLMIDDDRSLLAAGALDMCSDAEIPGNKMRNRTDM